MNNKTLNTFILAMFDPTDEEIQKEIDAEGLADIVKPDDIKSYYKNKLYEALSKK